MHYVERSFLCDRLKISEWSSYRLFPSSRLHMVSTDSIIGVLNDAAVKTERLDYIPSDICTADDIEKETGIPAKRLLTWTRRRSRTAPHYRINKQITRFRRSDIENWIMRMDREH